MATLIITFIIAGILAGLIQYFVDFLKLPIYTPMPAVTESVIGEPEKPGFLTRFWAFLKGNWEFFGYIVVGIAGAFLVPVIDQSLHLAGVADYLKCIGQYQAGGCQNHDWNLLIIFGYGIISGYSSVRIIRSFGTLITDKMGKDLDKQKKEMEKTQKELAELKARVHGQLPPLDHQETPLAEVLEGEIEAAHYCDAHEAESMLELNEAPACPDFPGPWTGKKWRVAKSLATLLNEVNKIAPERNKKSDGTVGDLAHQGRNSDHNPYVLDPVRNMGIVTALDITHDPANGCDCNDLALKLESLKDKRIKYVIWNKRIMSSTVSSWKWRAYAGANPHTKHIHISVNCEICDDDALWNI